MRDWIGVTAPAVVIRFELEAPPAVFKDCASKGEQWRLEDWLNAHPEYWELLLRARDLAEAEAA